MDSSSIIVLGIALLILISFVVFSLEMYLPLHAKLEMYAIIRPYMFHLEANGLLTSDQESLLQGALEEIGLNEVRVQLDYKGQGFGDWIEVNIGGYFDRAGLVALFKREPEKLRMGYKKKIYIRHINN